MTLGVWRKAAESHDKTQRQTNKQFSSGTCLRFARGGFIQTLRFRGQISPAWAPQVISLSKKKPLIIGPCPSSTRGRKVMSARISLSVTEQEQMQIANFCGKSKWQTANAYEA